MVCTLSSPFSHNLTNNQASELDQKIADVYKHIQTERKILQASQALRQATSNQEVQRRTEAKIRDSERSLSYFEDTLRELQARKLQQSQPDQGRYGGPHVCVPVILYDLYLIINRSKGSGDGYDPTGRGRMPNSPEYNSQVGGQARPKKAYSNLDLIKAETPHTPAKISKMLNQLEFKLQVEMQYKKGIDKMSKLYQADGDKKSRADAEAKKVESEKKIQLLQASLKRYKNLHILDEVVEEEEVNGASLSHIPPSPTVEFF